MQFILGEVRFGKKLFRRNLSSIFRGRVDFPLGVIAFEHNSPLAKSVFEKKFCRNRSSVYHGRIDFPLGVIVFERNSPLAKSVFEKNSSVGTSLPFSAEG